MRALLLAALFAGPLLAGCVDEAIPREPLAGGEPLSEGVTAEPGWPPIEEAVIRPGVTVAGLERTCPSNFLFARPDNESLFLGVTATCMSGMVVGDFATIDPDGLAVPALVVYHSFQTMSEHGEADPDALEYNDFAVVLIDTKVRSQTHPAMLRYGGPTALVDAVGVGDVLQTYVPPTSGTPDLGARRGVVTGAAGDWAWLTYQALPSIPGMMGTGVVTPEGEAVGVVIALGVKPNPGANVVARLDTAMAYAREHANMLMDVVVWETLETATVERAPLP